MLVAEITDCIVGFVHCRHRRDFQTTLYEICVDQAHRRQGIGKALIQRLQEESICQGKTVICLKAPVGIAANDFYESLGFARRSVLPGKRRDLQVWTRIAGDNEEPQ
jgi:ribosomal protein S18 acetylase RimI-like enzyme